MQSYKLYDAFVIYKIWALLIPQNFTSFRNGFIINSFLANIIPGKMNCQNCSEALSSRTAAFGKKFQYTQVIK